MPLLMDLAAVPECCVDEALEYMAKAMSDGGREAPELWDSLPNRWAATHVELFTDRMELIVKAMSNALVRILNGSATLELRKADAPWLRWSDEDLAIVRERLEYADPATFSLDDWMILADYLVQRYLPEDVINSLAEYLAVRAVLLGKIQTNLQRDPRVTERLIGRITELLPTDFAHVPPRVLSPIEVSIMQYGKAHAAENIRHVSAESRHRFATIALEHIQGGLLGQREGTWKHTQTRMFDELSVLNRDMRRIAITEGGEVVNQGYVAALEPGRQVKRIEAYRGACDFCKSINGKVFTIVSADDPNRDGQTDVWVGKTNVGRSASPRRREGNILVDREPDELWQVTAGVIHPNCRGSWVQVTQKHPVVSQAFFDYLQDTLSVAAALAPRT